MAKASMSEVRATRTIRAIGNATPRSFRSMSTGLIMGLRRSRFREVVPDFGAVALAQFERCDFARLQPHAEPPGAVAGDLICQHVSSGRDPLEPAAAAPVRSQHPLQLRVRPLGRALEKE